jgi:hypothetical protein
LAGVETRSCTGTSKPSHLIRVVRDDDECLVAPVSSVRRVEVEFTHDRGPVRASPAASASRSL